MSSDAQTLVDIVPQGLKPTCKVAAYGTAEAVPLIKPVCLTALEAEVL